MADTFGQLVTELRERRKLTQARLAALAECDNDTIARVEQERGEWFRRTAMTVFEVLADAEPIHLSEATRYFALSKYKPTQDRIDRYIADGLIHAGSAASAKPAPIPADLTDLVGKLVYSFGEHRVRSLLRSLFSFAAGAESAPPTAVPGAVAIDFDDPESGLSGKKFIPFTDTPPPASTSRRKKSG